MGQDVAVAGTEADLHLDGISIEADEQDWGEAVHRDLLSLAAADHQLLPPATSVAQRLVFQKKLAVLAESPANYLRPFASSRAATPIRLELSVPRDRLAATTACVKLRGVSRWKPNLVPRLVSEQQFFSNLFSYIVATADEHFASAREQGLEYIPHTAGGNNNKELRVGEVSREEDTAGRLPNGRDKAAIEVEEKEKEKEKGRMAAVVVEKKEEKRDGDGDMEKKEESIREGMGALAVTEEGAAEPKSAAAPARSALVKQNASDSAVSKEEHGMGEGVGANGTAKAHSETQKAPKSSMSAAVVSGREEPKRKPKKTVRFSIDIQNWKAQARFGTIYPAGATTSELKASFSEKSVLFFLEKSQNKNCVVYTANVDEDGRLDRNNPIHPYWILYDRNPVVEEELTMAERLTAYGTTVSPIVNKPGHYLLTITSVPSRPFEVWADSSGFLHTIGKCNGRLDEILSIFVQVNFNWIGIPTVEYVDLLGREGKERIYNNR